MRTMIYQRLYLCFWFLLSFSFLTTVVYGFEEEEDNKEPSEQVQELLKLLQVEKLLVPELNGTLELDGVLSEPFWEQAAHYEIKLETYPALLEPSPVKTEVKVGLNGNDLVIGFIAYDPEPENIQAPLRDKDSIEIDDYVGISIDPTGKLLNTFEFYVSASGVQADWVRNRVDDTRSRDWDANWESAAKIDTFGYSVEMRIAISELEIPSEVTSRKRIVLFKRHYPRAIRHHLTAITIREVTEANKLPESSFIVVPGITLLNNYSRDPEKDSSWDKEPYQSELSLDLGYKIGPSFGIWATCHPNG